MDQPRLLRWEDLFLPMLADCQREAVGVDGRLQEVIERLGDGDHLAALGAWSGVDESVQYIGTILKRLARLADAAEERGCPGNHSIN